MTATTATPTPACAIASLRAAAMECCAPTSPRVTLALRLATMATTSTRTPACARARAHAAATGWLDRERAVMTATTTRPTRQRCWPASCGDGVVQEGERCDDGNEVETDDCLSLWRRRRAGDGVVHEGVEGCDDGNPVAHDGCTLLCEVAPAATASAGSISRRKIRALRSVMTATKRTQTVARRSV